MTFCCRCYDEAVSAGADPEDAEVQASPGEERYSLGIYAGTYCDAHWAESGYRDEPASAFDPMDAGESYEEE